MAFGKKTSKQAPEPEVAEKIARTDSAARSWTKADVEKLMDECREEIRQHERVAACTRERLDAYIALHNSLTK